MFVEIYPDYNKKGGCKTAAKVDVSILGMCRVIKVESMRKNGKSEKKGFT